MHEIGITENIIAIVLEQAKSARARRITRINVVLGEFSGLTDESISFYFDSLSENSIAANASLNFRHLPVRMACSACGKIYPAGDPLWRCPACRSREAELIGGHECYVESIEVE